MARPGRNLAPTLAELQAQVTAVLKTEGRLRSIIAALRKPRPQGSPPPHNGAMAAAAQIEERTSEIRRTTMAHPGPDFCETLLTRLRQVVMRGG
ncbi:MAG TPA: hypothetical protein VHW90_14220 [Stellaceae bacterium]|jgi:hypothetical protein|nr:hypothetical protein [Stellaceae bacterium]